MLVCFSVHLCFCPSVYSHLVIFLIRLKTKEVVISKGSSTLHVSPSKGKCFSLGAQATQRAGERKKKTSERSFGKVLNVSEVFSLLISVFSSFYPQILLSFCRFPALLS